MARYRIGLRFPPTRRWVEARWHAFGASDRDRFVREVLLQPDRHILPFLVGEPEDLAQVRQKHLAQLTLVFGATELEECLRGELDPILDALDANGG
jgi:hypothetical protein